MIASSFGKLKDYGPEDIKNVKKKDVAKSLITLVAMNNILMSRIVAEKQQIKNILWIGTHIDSVELMKMSEYSMGVVSGGTRSLMFSTYHSYLPSLGLLLATRQ